jgi:hypothetical protein
MDILCSEGIGTWFAFFVHRVDKQHNNRLHTHLKSLLHSVYTARQPRLLNVLIAMTEKTSVSPKP